MAPTPASRHPARSFAAALEPLIGQVYFAPEAHRGYAALGFAPSPAQLDGLEMPDGAAYFTSRGSLMGQVAGNVVAAAFGVFNPVAVIAAVNYGWTLTDAATIRRVRQESGVGQLRRILPVGSTPEVAAAADQLERATGTLRPEGRALFAGAQEHFDDTDDPWSRLFQFGDMLREFRGDSHTASWICAGVDAVEVNLMSERYMGIPPRTYARTRAWSEAEFDAAADRLRSRGWFDGSNDLTPAGHAAREAIETTTDAQMVPAMAAFGDALGPLVQTLESWGAAIRAAHGYPGGPGDLWPNR